MCQLDPMLSNHQAINMDIPRLWPVVSYKNEIIFIAVREEHVQEIKQSPASFLEYPG